MDEAEAFRKEMEKFMPKLKPKGTDFVTGAISWVFIAIFACVGAWVVGAMIGLAASAYHLVTRLLG